MLIRHWWQLKTVVFLHWCLIRAVLYCHGINSKIKTIKDLSISSVETAVPQESPPQAKLRTDYLLTYFANPNMALLVWAKQGDMTPT